MLAFIWEPIRIILSFLESIVVFFGFLIQGGGQIVAPGDYLTQLNCTKIFANRAQDAVPQTAMYDVVMDFFKEGGHEAGKTPKCLVIGYDGARADLLINTKDDPTAGTQILKADGGAIYNMYTGGDWYKFNLQSTVTACGWTTLLTGHWAKEKGDTGHRVTGNGVPKPADAPKLIFTDLLEADLAQKTNFIVSWLGHFADSDAAYIYDIKYWNDNHLAAAYATEPDDEGTFAATLAAVNEAACADMIMCILEYCDHAGHAKVFGNTEPTYVAAFKEAEEKAADLIAAVKARPTYSSEDWLIIITPDHGGTFSGHGAQYLGERQTFFAVNKKVWE